MNHFPNWAVVFYLLLYIYSILHGHDMAPGFLEQVKDLCLPERLRDGDRGLAIAVDGVDLAAGVDQEWDRLNLPRLHRHVQRGLLAQVLRVQISS